MTPNFQPFFKRVVDIKKTKKRTDIVIKAANTGRAVFVRLTDLYQKEALRQLSDTSFYAKVDKDLTFINQKIVKNTINDLLTKQELLATAKNLTINTPRTSCIYFLPQIHKPNHPGRPTHRFSLQLSNELISSYLDKIMACTSKLYYLTLRTANMHLKFS